MAWNVIFGVSTKEDLTWFPKRIRGEIVRAALERLGADPITPTKHLKELKPNELATHQLRIMGKYRVLFNLDLEHQEVNVTVIAEKKGNKLIWRGEELVP